MKNTNLRIFSFLILFFAAQVHLFAGDKIYKTYQDFLDGKPMAEGSISPGDWSALTLKISNPDGEVRKVNAKEIWGFERNENPGNMQKVVFVYRVVGNQILRCLSQGKFNCWMPVDGDLIVEPRAKLYIVMPGSSGSYNPNTTFHNSNMTDREVSGSSAGSGICFYSISLGSDLIKLKNLNDFWPLIKEDEKTAIEAKMKKSGLVRFPYYAVQFYNQLYPIAATK